MTWLSATTVAVVTVAWVLLPGLVAGYALGLRGLTAWGTAPAVSIGSLALVAVLAGQAGIPWSPAVAAGGSGVIAAAAFAVQRLARISAGAGRDGRGPAVAALVGTCAAAVVATVTAVAGIGGPDRLSQTYDAVFHYNAVAEILDTANASSLVLGRLTNPSASVAFYPAAWHDLVSMVVLSSAASVPVATNIVAIVVAAVAWPLSCLVLVRQVTGRSASAALVTPLVAVGFIAFPWTLMGYGVLWPNLIGLALVPAGLAAAITLCGLARDSALSRGQALVVALFSVGALFLAHPSAAFSLAALSAVPFLWWLAHRLRLLAGAARWVSATATMVAVLTVGVASAYLLLFSPLFDEVRAFDWPAYQSPPQAAGEVLLSATNGREAAWSLSVFVVLGAVAAARSRSTRWLIPAHLVSGGLFLLASSLETAPAAALTGVWYNDSYRLAAMIPITGVPLIVVGLLAVGAWAAERLQDFRASNVRPELRAGVLTAAATVLLVVLSSGMYTREHADAIAVAYTTPAESALLNQQHRDFLERVGPLIPADAVVVQNPWTGSALLWSLTDREVLFPHLDGRWTADQRYLADHLDEAARDVRVCAIAARLDVEYVLTGDVRFWPWDARSRQYPGLDSIGAGGGFELVATGPGAYRLYRISACEGIPGGSS